MIFGIDGIVFWGGVGLAVFVIFAVTVFREELLP